MKGVQNSGEAKGTKPNAVNLGALNIGVLGRGQAASTLLPLWKEAGVPIAFNYSRQDGPMSKTPPADVLILAVSDGAIGELAKTLSQRESAPKECWIHLSGASPIQLMRVSETTPAHLGGLHPLVALQGQTSLKGATAGLEGDAFSLPIVSELARRLGLIPLPLKTPSARPLYHAAAVSVAGHVTALYDQALQMMLSAGIEAESARIALGSLLLSAAENLQNLSPKEALTGPIHRGDLQTIQAHLKALQELPENIQDTYKRLSQSSLNLVEDKLPKDKVLALQALLSLKEES